MTGTRVATPAPGSPAAVGRPGPGAARVALSGLGQTLITLGLVVLLFCGYELGVTGIYAARDQHRLQRQLTASWAAPPGQPGDATAPAAGPAADGAPIAELYLPSLPRRAPLVVVEGVTVPDLRTGGPGHLPGSALPGDVGNVVLSGHRTTYGAPFGDIGALRAGDGVVVRTRGAWFTYRVTGSRVVAPTAVEVTLPVPGRPGVAPTARLLTLTTCNPKYSARQRLIVSAALAEATTRPPPGLQAA